MLRYNLDISREEQIDRLKNRKKDLLKQWKISPINEELFDVIAGFEATRARTVAGDK